LYRFKFLALFCELGLKMLGTQQWQLLHVEKDDQVIRHNNNKTWEIRKAFLSASTECTQDLRITLLLLLLLLFADPSSPFGYYIVMIVLIVFYSLDSLDSN
jgi:hypothetical protein